MSIPTGTARTSTGSRSRSEQPLDRRPGILIAAASPGGPPLLSWSAGAGAGSESEPVGVLVTRAHERPEEMWVSSILAHPPSFCPSIFLSSIFLSLHFSFCPSIFLSLHFSFRPSIFPSLHLSVPPSFVSTRGSSVANFSVGGPAGLGSGHVTKTIHRRREDEVPGEV